MRGVLVTDCGDDAVRLRRSPGLSCPFGCTLGVKECCATERAGSRPSFITGRVSTGSGTFAADAFGTVDIPANHRDELRAAGIVVEPFRPLRFSTLHLAQNRSHVRGIVIDSRVGWTGGFGIDDKWLGDGRSNGSWRETNVRFEGPAVRQLQAAFAAAWVEATGVMFTGRATLQSEPNGATAAGLLYTAPTLGSTAAERFFALSIAGAKDLVHNELVLRARPQLHRPARAAAARRGVDVGS